MLKAAMSLLGILIYYSSLSQTCFIVDNQGNPVSYATIEVPKKKLAFFADVKGEVNVLSYDIQKGDTLFISAIGFNSLSIAAKDISGKLVLERQIKELQEVVLYNGKWEEENWGSKKKPGLIGGFGCSWRLNGPGSQIGRVIKVVDAKKTPALIYKVSFYTTHARDTRSPVRLRIYSINEKGLPGKDILQESIVENIDKNNGWLTFDLAGNETRIPDKGLIVAAEYFDTDEKNWNSQLVTYKDSTGKKTKMTDTWYGGNFATDDETDQGATLMRFNGYWQTILTNGNMPKCENLVVRVWVKYPEMKKLK